MANTVERRRAWNAIIAFGQHIRSSDIGRGMSSSPLGSTHGRATSGVACHHHLWAAHTVERRRAWLPSSPLVSINGQTTLGVACHHRLWAAHTVKRRRACRAIIVFGQHIRLIDVGRGMQSSPLHSTHGRATSCVACHHSPWTAQTVERRQAWHAIIAFRQHTRSDGVEHGMPS